MKLLTDLISAFQTKRAGLLDIHYCYRLLLGRKADREGWRHWSKMIASKITTGQLVSAFLASTEFHRKYALKNQSRVDVGDFVIYIDADDPPVSRAISQSKVYETHISAFLRNTLRPDDVFLDIGCSIGWFALLAASLLTRGKVIGIEPNQTSLQCLYRSLLENGFEHVVIFPYAATDRRRLFQLSGHASYGFVRAYEGTDDDVVQGMAVDEILGTEPRIDMIKIDIEGHEPVALQGMTQTIQTHRPLMLSEFHPALIRTHASADPGDYLAALQRMGYRLSVLGRTGQEIEFQKAEEVLEYWQQENRQQGSGDTIPLDLIARPTGDTFAL